MSKKNSLSFVFVFAFCLTFLLGTWQYQRLNWKNDLINNIEKSINEPFSFDEMEIYPELTSVILSDSYKIFNNPIFIQSKTYNGDVGLHLYFPVYKNNNLMTVINAGWTKSDDQINIDKIFNRINKEKNLNIYLRNFYKKKPYFTPLNNLKKNEWYYPGISDLEVYFLDKIKLDQYFVIAEASINHYFVNPKTLLRNSHLQYLLTWYLLSLTSLIMLIISRRKKNG
ncbi:MAG: hypothetical protein O3C61_04480 [Proteobacteria bacterium]|nr:hypothetical protein [Pseudomonadota bacterium]